jgi:predicted membrane-bound mannosyltransferase
MLDPEPGRVGLGCWAALPWFAWLPRDIRIGEFDYNVDEAQHAVTGLFIADAFRDLPIRHPVQYAYRYYAQYPAVAILHWPPLFYIFEGLSFLVLGPSVVSARLTVLLFCVLLLYQWFRLVEETLDSYTAGICTVVLGLLPMVLLFEKSVTLETPSLALGVAAIRHWIGYLEKNQRRSLYSSRFRLESWVAGSAEPGLREGPSKKLPSRYSVGTREKLTANGAEEGSCGF